MNVTDGEQVDRRKASATWDRAGGRVRTNRSLKSLQHPRKAAVLTSQETGGSLVELALVLPILLLVVTAIFSFGITINNYLELTDATAVGSRLLAISRGQTTDPCAAATQAIYSAAPFLKQSNMTFTYVFNGISYSGTSCSSSSPTSGAAGNMTAGSTAQVIVQYPCGLGVYGHNYAPNCNLVAQTTELVQ